MKTLTIEERWQLCHQRAMYGDYYSGYRHPTEFAYQIEVLRSYWPELNPDRALRYVREVYPKLQLPIWIEGPFAIIRPGFFSDDYEKELNEVLTALSMSRHDNVNIEFLGPDPLCQTERTRLAMDGLIEQQSESDILVIPAQFGMRHRGWAPCEVFERSDSDHESGLRTKDVATMILTHSIRFLDTSDLKVDCVGDECPDDKQVPCFYVEIRGGGGGREVLTLWCNNPDGADGHFGAASFCLPQ